ncbi:MAG TPA: DinB family protein [Patescibacteria group bacterium]|nr:DinB family protein [Patescibacteria group bacterium]
MTTTSILADAFEHHLWANEQILGVCAALTEEQLTTPVPGTYGPIIDTLRHIVQADSFYLWVASGQARAPISAKNTLSIGELRAANEEHAAAYRGLLAGDLDPDEDVIEHGDGWDYSAKQGIRLAQIVHHGSDHRSQVATGLTALGIQPPDIDLWAYGATVGRTRETQGAST